MDHLQMRNDWNLRQAAECCFSRLNSAASGTLYLISDWCDCSWKLWAVEATSLVDVFIYFNSQYYLSWWTFSVLMYFSPTHKQAALSRDNSIEGELNITQVEHKHLATHRCKALLNPIATVTSVTTYHSEGSSRDRRATQEQRRVECHVWRLRPSSL